jgi:hypothetical protein
MSKYDEMLSDLRKFGPVEIPIKIGQHLEHALLEYQKHNGGRSCDCR